MKSWQTVRDLWRTGKTGVILLLVSLFVIIYGSIALDYEITKGWKGHESRQNVVEDISEFIPIAIWFVGMIVGGIDCIMLLSDWYYDRLQKRREERERQREERERQIEVLQAEAREQGLEQGLEQGRKEGYAEGYAAAKAEQDAAAESPKQ